MKILILLLAVCLFSCDNNEDKDLKRALFIIDSLNKVRYEDSLQIERDLRLEEARLRLEQVTGKKDTLTNEERLEKAKEQFKQQ